MTTRRTCPICNYKIRLRNDGSFYEHSKIYSPSMFRPITPQNRCDGSRKKPEELHDRITN